MVRQKTQDYTEGFRPEAVNRFNRLPDKQFNTAGGVDYSKQESAELRKLRQEKAGLEKELAFLKRAESYVANHQERSTPY